MTMITVIEPHEYGQLLIVWEASVRATHDFITEQTIAELKPAIINDYLPNLTLLAARDKNQNIMGFAGVSNNKLEMLFIHPDVRGKGIGKALLTMATKNYFVDSVDVNEQNPQAIGFYIKQGFEIIGRSPLDGQGNPYPILHMRYNIK